MRFYHFYYWNLPLPPSESIDNNFAKQNGFHSNFFFQFQATPETDEDCLLFYSKEWTNYRWSSKVLNGVCRYYNEQMTKRDSNAHTVELMAYQIWNDHVYNHLNEKVSNAAVEMLERNRNGEIINTCAIKDVIQSYIELSSLEKTNSKDNLKVILKKIYLKKCDLKIFRV